MFHKIILMLALMFGAMHAALAQGNAPVEMADAFRADGKIYVVITVIAIILTGLFVYLMFLDKKIGKMEKEYNEQN